MEMEIQGIDWGMEERVIEEIFLIPAQMATINAGVGCVYWNVHVFRILVGSSIKQSYWGMSVLLGG